MSDPTIGVIVALMASVCWAVGSILVRLGIDKVSPPSATFFSILSGFFFVTVIALIIDASAFLEISASILAGFALVGLLAFMGGRLLYYTSVSLIGVGRATAMGGATPIVAAVLAVLFLDEQLTVPLAIGIMAVVVGIGLIVSGPGARIMTATRAPGESGTGDPTKGRIARLRGPLLYGTLASLLSVTGYGSSQVVARSLLTGDTPPQVGSAVTLFVAMLFLGGMSARSMKKDIRAPKRAIAWIMLAGILASTGAYLSFIALSLAPIVLISPLVAVSPLVTLILAAIFLRQVEKITIRIVLGACLVVFGVILVIVGNS